MVLIDSPWALPAAGLLTGTVMGYVARRSHFCTMSALERYWYAGNANGLRAWVLAAATALVATQAMVALGWINISSNMYVGPMLPIAGPIVGGLMFGFGMAFVGTCGFGALIRLGGGNLRALVVLTGIALAAMAAERGLTGHVREALVDPVAIDVSALGGQSLGAIASTLAGRDVSLMVSLVISILMIAWVLRDGRFRADKAKLRAGLTIGLCIAAGWYFTSMFAQRLFVPVQLEAGSFVSPLADTILQIVTVTGALPDYGVGLVVGVLAGAAVAAWHSDDMRWEACDDARELSRHLLGAFLMGTGGILAFGCTIGQGVSAFSVLALSAPIVVASIALGARVGLAVLVEGSPFGFLTAGGRQPAE